MIPIIYPYKMGSSSAKALADILRTKRVRPDGYYYHRARHLVVNWGNSTVPDWYQGDSRAMLNYPNAVRVAANKLSSFLAMSGYVSIPEFTSMKGVAEQWLSEGSIVVCRTTLNGHSGSGIVIAESLEQCVDAPLYTKHVRHKKEFRVHVFKGNVIDFSEKKRSQDSDAQTLIRNHHTGWIYARDNVPLPTKVKQEAINAVGVLGLDFGAVDVGYRVNDDEAFVFEVNTSPGLEGTTLLSYAKAIAWECYNEL